VPEQRKIRLDLRERKILAITCLGHFLSHFNMLTFPAIVLPLSSRLGLELGEALALSFWMYLLFGLTALPWGLIGDRIGARALMLLFYGGAGLSGLFAAWNIKNPVLLSGCLASLGLFSGIYHPIGLGLISKEVRHVSRAMGYNGMFGNLGLALAPLLAGLLNWLWGLRAVYIVLGFLNLVGFFLTLISSVLDHSGSSRTKKTGDGGLVVAFTILLIAMMLEGIAYRGATVISPTYFELKNQDLLQWISRLAGTELSANLVATATASLIYFVGMLGQFSGGRVAERFDPRHSYLLFHLMVIPPAFLIPMTSDLVLVGLVVVYFFFLLGMQPIENTLVARFTPRKFHHSAYGAKFVLTFGVGAIAVKMLETIESRWGIEASFPALGLVSIALVITIMGIIKVTSPSKK